MGDAAAGLQAGRASPGSRTLSPSFPCRTHSPSSRRGSHNTRVLARPAESIFTHGEILVARVPHVVAFFARVKSV
jgi:hypothetical protein